MIRAIARGEACPGECLRLARHRGGLGVNKNTVLRALHVLPTPILDAARRRIFRLPAPDPSPRDGHAGAPELRARSP
jgi:hypothetical protein